MLLRTKVIIVLAALVGAAMGAIFMSFAASDNTMETYCDIASVKEHKAVANWSSQGSPCVLTSSAWKIFSLFFFFGFCLTSACFYLFIQFANFLMRLQRK